MTKSDIKTNKLNIYLIKKGIRNDEIFKEQGKLIIQKLEPPSLDEAEEKGLFYCGKSHIHEPNWLKSFFLDKVNNGTKGKETIRSSSASAVYLVELNVLEDVKKAKFVRRTFALCFGYGRTMLEPNVYEKRFGLKITLSSIEADGIRAIDKKNMTANPKQAQEQISTFGNFIDFGISEMQDLLRGVTGKVKTEYENILGNMISGKDSVSISAKFNINNLNELLNLCYERYKSDDYKNFCPWIDNVEEVKDKNIKDKLYEELFIKFKNRDFNNLWMSVPEVLDWSEVIEFKYESESLGDDIDIEKFFAIEAISNKKEWSLKDLKKLKIECFTTGRKEPTHAWNILNCLYCEIKIDGNIYILTDALWCEVDGNFLETIEQNFIQLSQSPQSIGLPKCQIGMSEPEYNKMVANTDHSNFYCMDRKNIKVKGIMSDPIEFCDLISNKKQIIHVKYRYGSSALSHLFSQGVISARLFQGNQDFRDEVNKKLNNTVGKKFQVRQGPLNTSLYTIVYAVIYKKNMKHDLPFFSMVNLYIVSQNLKSMDYKVCFTKVESA